MTAAVGSTVAAAAALLLAQWAGLAPDAVVPLVALLLAGCAAALFVRGRRKRRTADSGSAPAARDPQPRADVSAPIDALADPALLVDDGLRVAAANAAATALFGPRAAGEDLAVAIRHPLVNEAAREALSAGGAVEREVGGLGRPEATFRLRATNLGDGRLLLTFADVSQARLAERMRADFVANASHELRTPLATISGFIETLLGPAADDAPARGRFLEIMKREADRMARLIDDLLSLSRIELDKHLHPRTTLALRPLLAEVGRTLAVQLEQDRRAFVIEAPDELPPVYADRDQILQVLHNLLSNALKYGRSGTPIRVAVETVERSGGRGERLLRVSVSDEGDGIPPEHLPRLTERFYRVDDSRSRQLGGTGLGLAIVKHIVERHRGRLEIASRQGRGTTVSFTLPVAAEAGSLDRPVINLQHAGHRSPAVDSGG